VQEVEIKKIQQINRDKLYEECKKLNLPVFENDDLELLQLLYNAAMENQLANSTKLPKENSN